MSQQELTSYRLSSLQEPSDEMLHALMEQVAERARQSTAMGIDWRIPKERANLSEKDRKHESIITFNSPFLY